MKTTQTDDIFMSLVANEGNAATTVQYHKTATEAVEAAGVPKWDSKYPAMAARSLEPGDELSVTSSGSVIRLTGRDIDYNE